MANIAFNLLLNGGVGSGLTSAFGSVGKKIAGLQSDLKALNQTSSKINQFKTLTAELKKFQAEMDAGSAKKNTQARFDRTKTALAELSTELKKAGVNMDDLAGAEKRLASQTDGLNSKLGKQQAIVAKQKAVQGSIDKARNMRQSAFSGGLTGIVAPMLALAAPVRAAIQAEEKMAEVKKVTNDLSENELKQLNDDLLKMSTRMPMSFGELADITAAAAQSGIGKTRQDFVSFSEVAGQMGVAFDISGGAAGKMMADWRAGMGLTQAQANDLADMVNHVSNNMNAQAADLGEIIQRQGAVGKAAGLADNEIVALAASMKATGAGTEIAATGFKNFLNAMGKGRFHSKSADMAFARVGLDPVKIAKMMQKDAKGAILHVLKTIKAKAPAHELNALVGKIFGEESKGAITPLIENIGLLEQAFGLVGDKSQYAGSMLNEYKVRSQTTANNLKLAGNQLNALGIVVGSFLLPPLNQLLGVFGKLSLKLMEVSKEYPNLTQAVVGGTAGVMAAGSAFNLLAGAAKFSIGGVGEAYGVLRKISMIRIGPLGLAAVAIGGLIAALNELGVLQPLIEGFNEAFNAVMPGIKEAIQPGIETVKQMLKDLQEALKGMGIDVDLESWKGFGKVLGDLAGGAVKYLADGLSGLIKVAKSVGDTLGGVVGSLSTGDVKGAADQYVAGMQPVLETLRGMAPGVYDVFDEVGKGIGTFAANAVTSFETLTPKLVKLGTSIYDNITWRIEAARQIIVVLKDRFEQVIKDIKAYLSRVDLLEEGKKLIQSLIDGIKAKADEALAYVRKLGEQIKSTISEITPAGLWNDTTHFWAEKAKSVFGKKATGGLVQGGRPYLVGERGPELIVPSAGAKVIPNHHVMDYLRPAGAAAGLFPGGGILSGGLSLFNMMTGGGLGSVLGNILQNITGSLTGGIFELLSGGRKGRPSISIPMPGGHTVNVTVNIPAGLSNPDQVRQAASDGIMNSVDSIKRAISRIYQDERRLSFA